MNDHIKGVREMYLSIDQKKIILIFSGSTAQRTFYSVFKIHTKGSRVSAVGEFLTFDLNVNLNKNINIRRLYLYKVQGLNKIGI